MVTKIDRRLYDVELAVSCMNKRKIEYPSFYNFLCAHFHMDWKCDFDSFDDAVDDYINDSSKESLVGLADDIGAILSLELDEEELDIFLLSFRNHYLVWRESAKPIKVWLFELANKLYEHAYS